MLAADYSFSRPSADALRKAGISAACRYLSHDPSKNLSSGELAALLARDLVVVLNWETTERRYLAGRLGGRSDAHEALRQALELGASRRALRRCAIYFSIDWDVSTDELPTVAAYIQGCVDVLGRRRLALPPSWANVGAYGGINVIRYLFDRRLIAYGWQTSAWSHGAWEPRAALQQYDYGVKIGGADVDLNRIMRADFGAYPPPEPPQRPWLPWVRWRRRPSLVSV